MDFEIEDGTKLPLEFQLWLGESTSEVVSGNDRKFNISTNLFLSRIADFQSLRRRWGNFPLEYGAFFEELISQFRADAENLEIAKSQPDLRFSDEIVIDALREGDFLRWNSQSSDQLRDIGRLALLSNGANFSVPGAGKTNALLAVHLLTKLKHPMLKLLVVCPKNAMLAWDEEVAACFGQSKKVLRLDGNNRKIMLDLNAGPDIAVISYQRLNGAMTELSSYMRTNEVHLVLDESHRIKAGEKSQQGAAAIALADYAVRRDILSGTPMPQNFNDIEAQFRFLWPRKSIYKFSEIDPDNPAQVRQANQSLRPFFVRTTKRELGLPKPRIRYLPVEMSITQKTTWDLLRNETARFIAKLDPQDKSDLRAIGKNIMRVLQFCSDPNLLFRSLPVTAKFGELHRQLEILSKETSKKFELLDRLVAETMSKPGAKVVVWSMFVDQIEQIAGRYSALGATSIHGGVQTGSEDDLAFREARIKMFKTDPDCRVLVANPAACGEGISLHTAAHHAIYFDRSFNAAHFLQSIDRIHRRGLPRDTETRIDILVLADSIEEAVRDRLSDKIKRLQQLLDDGDLAAMVYDPDDLREFGEDDIFNANDIDAVMNVLKR